MPDGSGYRQRNRANVQNSYATLIVSLAVKLTGRSLETSRIAASLRKPCLHLHPAQDWKVLLQNWLKGVPVKKLNVAGPRASQVPGIGDLTCEVLDEIVRTTKT